MTWWQWVLLVYVSAGLGGALRAISTRRKWLHRAEFWSWLSAFGLLFCVTAVWPVLVVMDLRQWVALQRIRTKIARSQGIPRSMVTARWIRSAEPPPDLGGDA